MKPAVRSSIIILSTLLIGIAIGFEVSEISIRKRMQEFRSVREPEGFVNMFGRILKPDEKQRPGIDSILIRYHNRIEKVSQNNMSVIAGVIDSMKNALKTRLTPDQIMRLEDEMKKMRRMGPPPPGGHRPPHGDSMMPPQPERFGGPPPDGMAPPHGEEGPLPDRR